MDCVGGSKHFWILNLVGAQNEAARLTKLHTKWLTRSARSKI